MRPKFRNPVAPKLKMKRRQRGRGGATETRKTLSKSGLAIGILKLIFPLEFRGGTEQEFEDSAERNSYKTAWGTEDKVLFVEPRPLASSF